MAIVSAGDCLSGRIAVGTPVTVQGWVRTRRDSKAGMSFVHLHDGSCFDAVQIVAGNDLCNYSEVVQRLETGCAIEVDGNLVESQGGKQNYEIAATAVRVVGWVEDPRTYPVAKGRISFERLREIAHLRPRTNTIGAVARVRHCLAQAIHRYFDAHGFYWIHTPIITASDCEGAGELFRVSTLDAANPPRTNGGVDFEADFFGRETFLTVSGQLEVEAYCLSMSKVYTFGPTFRAENSNTPRHLAEFWMVEPEIAFADLSDNADLAEDFLKSIYRDLLNEREDDLAFFDLRIDKGCIDRLNSLVGADFERLEYSQAVEILKGAKKNFEFPVEWGRDLQTEHERYLTEEHLKRPVIVMNYPKSIKPFYMRVNDDERTVAAMDVLAPGIGEVIGGSQREERLDVLDARLDEGGIDKEAYWWYRDLRRYGTVPHAGFGLGFERAIIYATGMQNIRDVIPFPRTPGHADF